jgi:hypothetical protein
MKKACRAHSPRITKSPEHLTTVFDRRESTPVHLFRASGMELFARVSEALA